MNAIIPDFPPMAKDRRLVACLLAALLLGTNALSGSASAASIVVDSLDDASPFDTADSACTLREAIANANNNSNIIPDTSDDCAAGDGADAITFSVAGTITLDSERLISSDVTKDDANALTIDGESKVTVSGGSMYSVLLVVDTPLTLEGITIADGKGNGQPGGIKNLNKLTIRNSTLIRNSTDDFGGAIYNGGDLEVINSTLSENVAKNESGGAIWNSVGATRALIKNSTLSGNSAPGSGGGGIYSNGPIDIVNSTLAGNSAVDGGGLAGTGAINITNSIVANSVDGGDCDTSASISAYGNNVDTDGSCSGFGFGQATAADLKLGPLFLNGGPTRTHALLAGSVAIDTGVQSDCDAANVTEDQRGAARPADGNADGVAACDIGAFEYVPPPPPPPPSPVDLTIAKTAAKTVRTGRQLTYTINVTNNGPNSAPDVIVNDVLPPGTSFVSLSAPGATFCSTPAAGFTGTVSCSYGSLSNGSAISPIRLIVKVTAKGNAQLNNTATVIMTSTTTVDPNTANNSATATSKVSK